MCLWEEKKAQVCKKILTHKQGRELLQG